MIFYTSGLSLKLLTLFVYRKFLFARGFTVELKEVVLNLPGQTDDVSCMWRFYY